MHASYLQGKKSDSGGKRTLMLLSLQLENTFSRGKYEGRFGEHGLSWKFIPKFLVLGKDTRTVKSMLFKSQKTSRDGEPFLCLGHQEEELRVEPGPRTKDWPIILFSSSFGLHLCHSPSHFSTCFFSEQVVSSCHPNSLSLRLPRHSSGLRARRKGTNAVPLPHHVTHCS